MWQNYSTGQVGERYREQVERFLETATRDQREEIELARQEMQIRYTR